MSIKAGATSQSIPIFITDTSGNPLTGLAFNTASLTCYYVRAGGSAVAVTLATLAAANSAWSSGGFKEIDGTNMSGWYRFDVPNAAIAASATSVGIHFKGAASMSPLPLKIDLVAYDPQDTVRLGLTALPNVAAGASGGLPTGNSSGQVTVGSLVDNSITTGVLATNAVTEITDAVQANTTLATLAPMIVSGEFTTEALANAPGGGGGSSATAFAVLGMRAVLSGQIDDDDYISVISGDDKSVGIFFEDASGNPAPLPSGATAAMLDAAGDAVGTATVSDSKITIGYLLIRLQVPSSGNPPAKLRITFAGGSGAAYKWDVQIRAWS